MSNLLQSLPRHLGQYRIGSQESLDREAGELSSYLESELEKLTKTSFKVTYATGQQYGGFTRFTFTRQGVQGPNQLTLDIRAGGESAYIDPSTGRVASTLGVKMGGVAQDAAQIAVGMKIQRRNQEWEERAPSGSLADLIAGAFVSAGFKYAEHGEQQDVDVRRELFALGTEGTERHAEVRRRYGIPQNFPIINAISSQGGQIAASRRVGIAFSDDEEIFKQQYDLEESLALRTDTSRKDRGIFSKLFQRGAYIVPDSKERTMGLEWMGSAREVAGERQVMLHGGADPTDYLNFERDVQGNLVNPTGSRTPWTDAVVAAMKHLKNKTTLQRSREYVQPLTTITTDVERGTRSFVPLGPQPIGYYEKHFGQRYWEKSKGPLIIHSGIIESGESAPRMLQVVNTLIGPTPLSGGGIVDESAFEGLEGYGIQTRKGLSLDFANISDVNNAKFHILNSRGKISNAGQTMGLGYIQYGSLPGSVLSKEEERKWKKDRTRSLTLDSGPRAQQLLGMTMRLPEFYDPVSGNFVPAAERRGDRYYAIGTNTEVARTQDNAIIRAKAAELARSGVDMDYTYESVGGAFEASVLGQVGAAWKNAGMKPGMVLRQGSERMFFQPEGRGYSKQLVDFATGELKDPSEFIKGTFRMQTFGNRINMLRTLGKMNIDGKSVDVGGKLANWASKAFAGTQTISVDALVSEYRRITGSTSATEESIWLGMYNRLESMSDKEAKMWATRMGVSVPKDGWLDAGYISGSQAAYFQKEQDQLLNSTPGSAPLMRFLKSDNQNYMRLQVKVQGRTAKGLIRSLIAPMGMEAAVEYGGQVDSINFQSSESLESVMPSVAESLRVRPEDAPAIRGASAAWMNVMKAWSLTDSYKQGYNTEYRNRFVVDRTLAGDIYSALREKSRDQSVTSIDLVKKIITDEFKRRNPDYVGEELPDDLIMEFEKSHVYMPSPDAALNTDILEPTRRGLQSKGHMVEQYIDAIRDLSNLEQSDTVPSRRVVDSYQRYLGAVGSRIGKLLTKGKSITDQLLSKEITGAVHGHYFAMLTPEVGEMYLPDSEANRLMMSVAKSKDPLLVKELRKSMESEGIVIAAQRDPVVSTDKGTVPMLAITDTILRKRGLNAPKAPWAYGAFGVSAVSTLGMIGDFDFDPMRIIAAANQLAARKEADQFGFNKAETYTDALETLMRGEAAGYNVIRSALKEGMDPNYSPFKMAAKTGWAKLDVALRANKLYNTGYGAGGIMPLRGLSYTAFDKFRVALAMQHPGGSGRLTPETTDALASFTAQYQKTLEVSMEAAQESAFQSLINKASLRIKDGHTILSSIVTPRKAETYAEFGGDSKELSGWKDLYSWENGNREATVGADNVYIGLSQQGDITDAMLATLIASGSGEPDWNKNVSRILGQLEQARAGLGKVDDATWLKKRYAALKGMLHVPGQVNLFDDAQGNAAGKDTLMQLSLISTALERMQKKISTGENDLIGDWLAPETISWKGKKFSMAQLYEEPEFQAERYARSLLTASTIDPKRSLVPPAHTFGMIKEWTNPNSALGIGIRAAASRMGIYRGEKRRDAGVSPTEVAAISEDLPYMIRGSEISSIVAQALDYPSGIQDDPNQLRRNLMQSGFPFKAMMNIAMRNVAGVFGEKISGDILKEAPLPPQVKLAQERGTLYEKWLERNVEGLIRAPEGNIRSQKNIATFGFRFRDPRTGEIVGTDVWGTPDFFRLSKDDQGNDVLEIGEAKRYSDAIHGKRMAQIQASLYREGLINMAQGLGATENPADELRTKLYEWYRLANQQRKEQGLGEFDYGDYADRAFKAISNKRVVTRAFAARDLGQNPDPDKEFMTEEDPMGVLQESGFVAAADYIYYVNNILKGNKSFLTNMFRLGMKSVIGRPDSSTAETLTSAGIGTGAQAGIPESLLKRIPELIKALEANTGATWVDRGWASASDSNIPGELMARNMAILGKDYQFRMGPKHGRRDRSTTLVAPGENIRNQRGEVSVVLGDTDIPGDQYTLQEAEEKGMLAPKEVVDAARVRLQNRGEGHKAAQAKAVEVLSRNVSTHMGAGDVIKSSTDPNDVSAAAGNIRAAFPPTATNASTGQQMNAILGSTPASTPGGGAPGGGGTTGSGGSGTTGGGGWGTYTGPQALEDRNIQAVEAFQLRLNLASEWRATSEAARQRLIAATGQAPETTMGIDELLPLVQGGTLQKRAAIGTDLMAKLEQLAKYQKGSKSIGWSGLQKALTPEQEDYFTQQAAALGMTYEDLVDKSGERTLSAEIGRDSLLFGLAKSKVTSAQRKKELLGNMTPIGLGLEVKSSNMLAQLGLGGKTAADIMELSQTGGIQGIANQVSPEQLQQIKALSGQVATVSSAGYGFEDGSALALQQLQREMTKVKTSEKGVKMQQLSDAELVTQSRGFEDISSKLIASLDKLEKATSSHEKVTKEDIDASKKMHEDVTSQLKILEKQGVLGQTRMAIDELTGGRDLSALTTTEKAQYRNLRAMEAGQLASLEKEMMDINKARLFEDENKKPMARFGNTLRGMFGGWGMMYMQRAIGVGLEALTGGGPEAAQFAAAEKSLAYATGVGAPGISQAGQAGYALQRGLIRQGEGGLSAYTRFKASMAGTPLGEVVNAGQLGLATTLGSTFMMGELAQMGVMSSAAAGTVGAGFGIAAAVSYPYIQGFMRANDPISAGISAAGGMVSPNRKAGEPMPLWNEVVNNFTALGQVARGTADWREYWTGQTEVQQTAREALWAADVIAGRVGPQPSAADTERYNANKLLSERTGAPLNKEDEEFMRKYELSKETAANPHMREAYRQANQRALMGMNQETYFMGLKAEIQATEGYFKSVSPEAALQAGYQLEAAGVRDRDRILGLAKKYDAGVNPELARSVMSAGRFDINSINYAAALENLPTSEIGAMRLQQGMSFLGNMSNAYINQMGFSSVQQFMETSGGRAVQWANSTYAPGIQMQSQMAERYGLYGFTPPSYQVNASDVDPRNRGAGLRTVNGIASPEEIAAMSPEQQREVYAQSNTYMKGVSAYENITELFGKGGVEMAQKFMETINQGGAIAGAAFTPAIGAMQNAFMMTGGNMQAAGAIGQQVMSYYSTPGQYGMGNAMMGAMSGDPYAMQRMMQQSPEMAKMLGAQGFGQLVDVNRQGQVTGLPLFTTNMTAAQAQTVWGSATNTPVAQAAVNGYVPSASSTGQALYGMRGIQAWQMDAGFNYQMQGIGLQQAGLDLQQGYMTQMWGVQDRMRAMNNRQAEWGFSNQIAGLNLNRQQFYENQGINQRSFTMQKQFAQKDWAYQDQVRDLQWQWKQEDYGEEVRFMTGRNRRLAERQMRRDTTMYNLEEDHIKDQRKQQQELWKLEDERFKLTKKHFEENYHFQMQAIEKQRAFYQERQKLELQMEQIQRRYQQEQMKLQQQQINLQRQYAEEMHRAQTQMMELSNYTQDVVGAWEQAWKYSELAAQVITQMATNIQNMQNSSTAPAPTGQAAGGTFSSGQSMWVGEWGPELVQFNTSGKVIPSPINPWQKTQIDNTMAQSGNSGAQTIVLNINVGNERLARLVIDAVSQEISV